MRRLVTILGVCIVLVLVGSMCFAAPKPTGKVIITVSGNISETNSDKGFELDMAMLEGIALSKYDGRDPWLGNKKYSGVLVSDILKFAGADSKAVEVLIVAKDGKKVTLKAADVAKYPIMIATQDGGKAIGSGLGGPAKLVFPYASHPEVEKLYPKEDWCWYVVGIEVRG